MVATTPHASKPEGPPTHPLAEILGEKQEFQGLGRWDRHHVRTTGRTGGRSYKNLEHPRENTANPPKKMAEVHGNRTHTENAGKAGVPVESGAESGALDARKAPDDPQLAEVIDAWPGLPDAVQAGILAMIRAAGGAS